MSVCNRCTTSCMRRSMKVLADLGLEQSHPQRWRGNIYDAGCLGRHGRPPVLLPGANGRFRNRPPHTRLTLADRAQVEKLRLPSSSPAIPSGWGHMYGEDMVTVGGRPSTRTLIINNTRTSMWPHPSLQCFLLLMSNVLADDEDAI